jgi:hypothetical protein
MHRRWVMARHREGSPLLPWECTGWVVPCCCGNAHRWGSPYRVGFKEGLVYKGGLASKYHMRVVGERPRSLTGGVPTRNTSGQPVGV